MSNQYLDYLLLGHLLPQLVHVLQLLHSEALLHHVGDQGDAGGEDQALLRQETVLVPPHLALAKPPQQWQQWRFLPTLIREGGLHRLHLKFFNSLNCYKK